MVIFQIKPVELRIVLKTVNHTLIGALLTQFMKGEK